MINVRMLFFFVLLIFILSACEQTKSKPTILGKSYAQQELKLAFTNKEQQNVIDNKSVIIKESVTAILVAEPILFGLYGKDNIVNQRPYEIYLTDNYWVISVTLSKYQLGGTFLIIINAKDSRVVKITHGK
jgi:hypothetical protein